MAEMGRLYGVSVGSGDPQSMTLGAVRTIEKCRIIAVPRTKGQNTLALSIAEEVCDLSGKRIVYIDFPMSRSPEVLCENYNKAAEILCTELENGDVAMLTLGDISVYSTFCYIADRVRERGFEAELSAGVTSFCSAAAALGKPLCLGSQPLHILPYDCENLAEMLDLSGTKVIMKTGRNSAELLRLLREKGLAERTMAVSDCGLDDEKIYRSCGETAEIPDYFTVYIVPEREESYEA